MSKPSKQLEFLDQQLPSILEPGENVLLRGISEDPARWAFAKLTLGLLFFLRRYYYVVVTDRRLLRLSAPPKRYFYLKWGFYPRFVPAAGLAIKERAELRADAITAVSVRRQKTVHMALGMRGVSVSTQNESMSFILMRDWRPIGPTQAELYNGFAATVGRISGVEPKVERR